MSGGIGDISSKDREIYKQQFGQAVDLFQQSLTAYEESSLQPQKDELKKVMDQALMIIHETIKESISQEAQKSQTQLDKDYQNFINNDTPQTYKQLNNDLSYLKRAN